MFVVEQLHSVRMAFIVGLIKRAVIKNIFPYFCSSFDDNLLKSELLSYLRFSFPKHFGCVGSVSDFHCWLAGVGREKDDFSSHRVYIHCVTNSHFSFSFVWSKRRSLFFLPLLSSQSRVSRGKILSAQLLLERRPRLIQFFHCLRFSFDLEILAKWKVCCRVRRKS